MTQHSRDTPQFYLTAPSPCPYLPGRHERKVFTHLVGDKAGDLNDLLTHGGFRRSQSIAYRPACDQCRACVSVRVVANEFRPSRNFKKVLARNADIGVATAAYFPAVRLTGSGGYLSKDVDTLFSSDSRVWGQVPERDIVGKAFAIWMHWDTFLSIPSFSRVGLIK